MRERRHPIEKLFALALVQTAPDAVRLTNPYGIFEAIRAHAAGSADPLGGALADQALFFALHMGRWKEDESMRTPTRGSRLPQLFTPIGDHDALLRTWHANFPGLILRRVAPQDRLSSFPQKLPEPPLRACCQAH